MTRLAIIGVAALAFLAVLGLVYNTGLRNGRDQLLAQQAAEVARRSTDAQAADDASRRNQLDPDKRLSNDGWRRD